jgi:23S rRNA (cytosine1962-C5)-methyltransferase
MDPPSYGRGSNGEIWDIEKDLNGLLKTCKELLSETPLFVLVNSYTTGFSPIVLENLLKLTINKKAEGIISSGEVGLQTKSKDLVLPCGIYGRWESK